ELPWLIGQLHTVEIVKSQELIQLFHAFPVAGNADIKKLSCLPELDTRNGFDPLIPALPYKFDGAGGIIDIRQRHLLYSQALRLYDQLLNRDSPVAQTVMRMNIQVHGL